MTNKEQEKIFNEFSDYLLKFGFLTITTAYEFNTLYKSQKNEQIFFSNEENNLKTIFFKDVISEVMIKFLNTLTDDRKKLLAINLYKKFQENQANESIQNSKLNTIVDILTTESFYFSLISNKKNRINNSNTKKKKTQNNTNYNNTSLNFIYPHHNKSTSNIHEPLPENINKVVNRLYSPRSKNNNNNNKNDNNKNINENNNQNNQINLKAPLPNKINEIVNRLYNPNDKNNQQNKRDKNLSENFTFKPKINNTYFPKDYSNNNNLIDRLYNNPKKKEKKDQPSLNIETFPFKPDIKISQKVIKKSSSREEIFNKLYKDKDKREKKYNEKQKEMLIKYKEMANNPIIHPNKQFINVSSNYNLYNNYGLNLDNNPLFNIQDNNINNNNNFLIKVNDIVNINEEINNENDNDNDNNILTYSHSSGNVNENKNVETKNYTKEEKEKIANNIIKKLYGNEINNNK